MVDSLYIKYLNKRIVTDYIQYNALCGNKIEINNYDYNEILCIHEIVEKALLDIFNLTYAQAHHIATYIEHEYATKHNINWKKYIKFLDPQMKHIGHEKVKKIPKSLDLQPYEDEKDFELLKRMKLHAR